MRFVNFTLIALALCGCQSAQKKSYDYCYANGHGLYVGNYGHDPVHVYVNGTDACLSPDGTRIAFVSRANDLGPTDINSTTNPTGQATQTGAVSAFMRSVAAGSMRKMANSPASNLPRVFMVPLSSIPY